MAYEGYSILAVIPARGGSKGIPHKNMRLINGVTLIGHAVQTALKSPYIDHVIVSTDSKQILEEGTKLGLDTPFLRPVKLSSDTALSIDVWKHAWIESEIFYKTTFDISILLEPTSPNREVQDIESAIQLLIRRKVSSVVTVSRVDPHYAPEKLLTIGASGRLNHFFSSDTPVSRRQDVGEYYYRNGVCYASTRSQILNDDSIISTDTLPLKIGRKVINIDTIEDLNEAIALCNLAAP